MLEVKSLGINQVVAVVELEHSVLTVKSLMMERQKL